MLAWTTEPIKVSRLNSSLAYSTQISRTANAKAHFLASTMHEGRYECNNPFEIDQPGTQNHMGDRPDFIDGNRHIIYSVLSRY